MVAPRDSRPCSLRRSSHLSSRRRIRSWRLWLIRRCNRGPGTGWAARLVEPSGISLLSGQIWWVAAEVRQWPTT